MVSSLVSVIIPVYNAEKHLATAIEGICVQEGVELEIILVNDGSTDGSASICEKYSSMDSRIKVLHRPNGGPSAARNAGLEAAAGEFIFFMDADDTLDRNSLKILMESIAADNSDWAIGDFKIIKNGTNLRHDYFFPENRLFKRDDILEAVKGYLLKPRGASEFTNVWGKLFRASIIRRYNIRFNEELWTWEDVVFNFDYLARAGSVSYVRKQLYDYHMHPGVASCGTRVFELPLGFNEVLKSIACILREYQMTEAEIAERCSHASVYFAVKTLLVCFNLRRRGKCGAIDDREMLLIIRRMLNDPAIRSGARHYRPSPGESVILPRLMKYNLTYLIYLVCSYKAGSNLRKEMKNAG